MKIEHLKIITEYLKEKVWRNEDAMYMQSDDQGISSIDPADLIDIISSLHNLLYEAITGERYNYAFHWCNKIGAWTEDNIFDDILQEKDQEKKE